MGFEILTNAGWLILGALFVTIFGLVAARVEVKEIFPRAGKYMIGTAIVVCVVIAFAVVATQCNSEAHAQDRIRPEPSREEVLALARVCWSERDARVDTRDCGAIAEVTRTRAAITGRSFLEQLRAYSPEATGSQPTERDRQRWVSQLRLDGNQPDEWSVMNARRTAAGRHALPWSSVRERWMATIREAESLIAHAPDACIGTVEHWGGDMDRAPRHWVRVDCGTPVVNTFYRVPPRPRPVKHGGTVPARLGRGD